MLTASWLNWTSSIVLGGIPLNHGNSASRTRALTARVTNKPRGNRRANVGATRSDVCRGDWLAANLVIEVLSRCKSWFISRTQSAVGWLVWTVKTMNDTKPWTDVAASVS